jgi:hypothetical protein
MGYPEPGIRDVVRDVVAERGAAAEAAESCEREDETSQEEDLE